MRIIFLLFAFLGCFSALAADFEPEKVVNGTIINSKNSPYVYVVRLGEPGEAYEFNYVTGTLISNKHVIVAAHNLKNIDNLEHYYVVINEKRYNVKKITVPSFYNPGSVCSTGDIAIITLKKAVKSKTLQIIADPKRIHVGDKATYAGYGCPEKGMNNCWGTLRQGSSYIQSLRDYEYAILNPKKDSNGYVYQEGGPATTIKTTVKKVVKTKKGKRKVKKVNVDAIIGLNSCYLSDLHDQSDLNGKDKVILLQKKEILDFIKKATNRKVKIIK